MMLYTKFQSVIDDQEDVRLILEQNASNLIKFIDTSLQESDVTDRIKMPLKTPMITFRSN